MSDHKNLFEMMSVNAVISPKKKYIFFKEKTYTYAETLSIVENAACVMAQNGVKKGDRVCLLMGNSPEFVFGFFAIMKLGAIAIPTNTFLKVREVGANMADCEAEYMITSQHFEEIATKIKDFDKHLDKIFSFEDTTFTSINLYQKAGINPKEVQTEITPDDLAVLIYTSGTTGKPKGVMLTHKNLLANSKSIIHVVNMTARDRFLSVLPMFHSYAFTINVITPLNCNASTIILESVLDMQKKGYKKMLMLKRPSIIVGVPQIYSAMARMKVGLIARTLFPFRAIVSGGASLPGETLRRFEENFGRPLLEGYGLSEASPVVCFNPPNKQKVGTVGLALKGVEVKVVDENDNLVPAGKPGELCVKGESVMKGYWNQPTESAKSLLGGWLHTGDVATIDEEGYVTIVDRKKDLIIVKGINVYPSEVEELLHSFHGINTVSIVGIPDDDLSEIIIAYVKPEEGETVDIKSLKQFAKKNLAAYKLPKYYVITNELPMTPTGKVLKKILRERAKEDMANQNYQ